MAKLRKRQRRKGEVATRRESIRNHCMECMGYQMAEIHECTATSCWLYPWRLGSVDRDWLKKEREEAKAEKKKEKPHILTCNAAREEPIGCPGCSCPAGRELKKLRSEKVSEETKKSEKQESSV